MATVSGYFTTEEAAEELDVTAGRVRQFQVEGRLPAIKVGMALLFPVEAVREFKKKDRPNGRPKNSENPPCNH